MHEVTYDFLVEHIKTSHKNVGDKPKSVYISLQTPHEVYIRTSYFLDNSADKHTKCCIVATTFTWHLFAKTDRK